MTETFIVTATPPTPNGDFHVGHLSGPYLGADIFSRYQRMRGATVLYVSSADTNQSYVVTTAERKGVDPLALAVGCHREMIATLAAGRIGVNAFNEPDAYHSALVGDFMRVLDQRGHVKRKVKRLPYSHSENRYLFESFVSGYCPECWAPTAGAIILASSIKRRTAISTIRPACAISISSRVPGRSITGTTTRCFWKP